MTGTDDGRFAGCSKWHRDRWWKVCSSCSTTKIRTNDGNVYRGTDDGTFAVCSEWQGQTTESLLVVQQQKYGQMMETFTGGQMTGSLLVVQNDSDRWREVCWFLYCSSTSSYSSVSTVHQPLAVHLALLFIRLYCSSASSCSSVSTVHQPLAVRLPLLFICLYCSSVSTVHLSLLFTSL